MTPTIDQAFAPQIAEPRRSEKETPEKNWRTLRCGRCGEKRRVALSRTWTKRSFVPFYCSNCGERVLLPTRPLSMLRVLAALWFLLSVAFVAYTIEHKSGVDPVPLQGDAARVISPDGDIPR